MGQRSQIYIRFHNEQGTQLIARYFQWNYSERMVSRARGIIECLELAKDYPWTLNDKGYITKLTRICDINFDMRDIVLSHDILKEVHDYFLEEARTKGFSGYIFGQDNNNGQLLIDVIVGSVPDDAPKDEKLHPPVSLKYAFLDYYTTPENIMDAEGYMVMDAGKNWRKKNLTIGGPDQDEESKCIVEYTAENIEYIRSHATLMTPEEVRNFINEDYSCLVEEA